MRRDRETAFQPRVGGDEPIKSQPDTKGLDRSMIEEPDVGSVVAVDWGYPNQEIWEHVSAGSWASGSHVRYSSWEDLTNKGEVILLVPADQDRYQDGWRAGRFALLNEMQAKLNQLGEETHRSAPDG